jgi:hypothetical protein
MPLIEAMSDLLDGLPDRNEGMTRTKMAIELNMVNSSMHYIVRQFSENFASLDIAATSNVDRPHSWFHVQN